MKTTLMRIAAAKPRNPLVVPSLRRKAGAHRGGSSASAQRQRAETALRRELGHTHEPSSP